MSDPELLTAMVISAGLILFIVLLAALVKWARRRSTGALAAGALLSAFAPDPTLERNIRLAEQAKTLQLEEEEKGGE